MTDARGSRSPESGPEGESIVDALSGRGVCSRNPADWGCDSSSPASECSIIAPPSLRLDMPSSMLRGWKALGLGPPAVDGSVTSWPSVGTERDRSTIG